jgi:glutathione peroxidase
VNGSKEHAVFTWLKQHLPAPAEDSDSLMADPKLIIWSPVRRSDISWNFEKFLVDKSGNAVHRYSRQFHTGDIEKDIVRLC